MTARQAAATVVIASTAAWSVAAGRPTADPFAFFDPSVRVNASDRIKLEKGEVIAHALPADDGHVAIFAATRLSAPPHALIEWTRSIEALKRGPLVLAVGRFANPPADDDLAALTLDNGELDALRRCGAGSCDLKLAAAEIASIRVAISSAPAGEWRRAALHAFRAVLIARVRQHRQQGLLSLPPYADGARRMSPGEAFSAIVARSPYLTRSLPGVVNGLLTPAVDGAGSETFYYWSREQYGPGRTVVTVTYVRLLEPAGDSGAPAALTMSTQLFASHYTEGALGLTAVVCDSGANCYLAYLNRTQVDVLGGLFGGLKRKLIEQRIESDTPALLRGVRQRLESGPPDPERDVS